VNAPDNNFRQATRQGRRVITMNVRAMMCAILILGAWPLSAGERLALKVSPAVAFAPANLIVRALVEADARNRAIAIVAESDDFYRASEVQLDGENAPRTTTFEFRSLPSGTYRVTAVLLDAQENTLTYARSQVNVLSNGGGR
jgi:hypothetical protein